ncbi:MFS transporter [Ottowia thiooxydans]|uniref:MFS family permease n=1 Tax=Ottowia thiooxydans TaxID=219182 RepID=A0ABV2QCH5_9BURK
MTSINTTHSPAFPADAPSGIKPDGHDVAPGDIAVGVVIGRASEYFDFFVYGIASALVFPSVFFPGENALNGTLYAFAIFALAFVARPIGTVLSMMVQRRWGRSTKLTLAMFLLGTCTAGIAFLPGYQTLGTTAVVLLALFRIGQGMALGGSWDGLPSLLAMNAPAGKRGWYAMLGQLGAPTGFILASGLFAYLYSSLTLDEFLGWGWRYPFFVAFAINVVALFARLRLVVTSEYEHLLDKNELEPTPIGELMANQGSNVIIGAFAALASYALFHLVTVFPLSWTLLYAQQPIPSFLGVQIVGGFLCAIAIVASGWLADRFGRRNTLGALALLIGMFSGFAPILLGGDTLSQDLFILIGFVLLGLSYGQASGTVTSNFLPRYRYTGAALTNDFAWLIGAAFAPLVALWLSAHFGLAYLGLYLLSGVACTVGALLINRKLESSRD